MIHLDYRDVRPIYAQIMDAVKEKIASGILQPGERLPSVRELAAELAINPNTIQRSYRMLEAEGWIVTVPGKGCFVCEAPETYQRELERLLRQLDETCDALTALGVTREDIIRRLQKEGNKHA